MALRTAQKWRCLDLEPRLNNSRAPASGHQSALDAVHVPTRTQLCLWTNVCLKRKKQHTELCTIACTNTRHNLAVFTWLMSHVLTDFAMPSAILSQVPSGTILSYCLVGRSVVFSTLKIEKNERDFLPSDEGGASSGWQRGRYGNRGSNSAPSLFSTGDHWSKAAGHEDSRYECKML